jgi:hypothetical protein
MNAPKRVVRDAQGRVAGVEPVPMTSLAGMPTAPVDHDPFAQ